MSTARLDVVVTSTGVQSTDNSLKQLTATAKETEKQRQHMAAVFAEISAAEEKEAKKAITLVNAKASEQAKASAAAEKAYEREFAALVNSEAKKEDLAKRKYERDFELLLKSEERKDALKKRQLDRENEQWNDLKQKALARYDKEVDAAEKADKRKADVAKRQLDRENEQWNNAIQRAKAGLDGVLPIRPSLQRIEAKINEAPPPASGGINLSGILAGGKEGAMSALGMGALAGGAATAAAAAVTAVASSVRNLTSAVLEDAIADEKMIARLGGLTDSAEAAADTFSDLEKQALGKLPSTVDELTNSFVQLGNNGLQNGQSALKAYSNIAAQTGASLGTVTSAVQQAALGNYRSLREFGIKIKEEGDNLKITFRGQTETISGGAESIEAYLQRLGTVQFAGAVERQMDTIGGTVKKTEDAWERLINTIGDSSIGSLVQSSIGASIGVIDAMAASVDALFGKTAKGLRDLTAEKARLAEQDRLDKEMMSWADPTASKTETARLAAVLQENSQSAADKSLAQYAKNSALIDKLRSLGETQLGEMTLDQAQAELDRQYMRDNGGTKTKNDGYTPVIAQGSQTNFAAYSQMIRQQEQSELEAVHAALQKKEDAAEDVYAHNKKILERSAGDQTAYLAANEVAWDKHLATVQAKRDKDQLELQKKLQNIGLGPQSQFDIVNRKYAGQSFDLSAALSDNMSGKNGADLQLQAEQTYADKSIEIERARAREIAQINRDLVQQSAQNAEAIFGGLAAALKNSHGEMSAEYRTMFAIQQAFGIASAELAMFQSMAEASKQPFPVNVPLYLKAAAQGAQLVASISSLSYSGAYDSGGEIPVGKRGDVAEQRPELLLVGGRSQVRGPATVIGGEATAALLGGRQPAPERTVIVIGAEQAFKGFLGSTPHERSMVQFIKNNGPLIRSVVGR